MYDSYAKNYDSVNDGPLVHFLGIKDMRKAVADIADANVLEVAVGTGLQLEYYNWNNIKSFVGIDSSPQMLRKADALLEQILEKQGLSKIPEKYRLEVGDAESMKIKDDQVLFPWFERNMLVNEK